MSTKKKSVRPPPLDIRIGSVIFVQKEWARSSEAAQRSGWKEHVIDEETRVSWVFGPSYNRRKIPKRGPLPRDVEISEDELTLRLWRASSMMSWRVSSAIGNASSLDFVRVALIVAPEFVPEEIALIAEKLAGGGS